MEEVCTMLLQIVTDRGAKYQVCQRLAHLLNMKRAVINREERVGHH